MNKQEKLIKDIIKHLNIIGEDLDYKLKDTSVEHVKKWLENYHTYDGEYMYTKYGKVWMNIANDELLGVEYMFEPEVEYSWYIEDEEENE